MNNQKSLLYALMLVLVVGVASAITIQSPEADNEYTSPLTVAVATNDTVDNLSFSVGNVTDLCTNCSELTRTILLEEGNYTLTASAVMNGSAETSTVNFTIIPDDNESEDNTTNTTSLELTIDDPEDATTYDGLVPVRVVTNKDANISYVLNDDDETLLCSACDEYSTDWNLSNGNYTVVFTAVAGNESVEKTRDFFVELEEGLTVTIHSPDDGDVYDTDVLLSFTTNNEANITYTLNDQEYSACTACTSYSDVRTLAEDNYTLTVYATSDADDVEATVSFTVEHTEDEDDGAYNGTPRYTTGYEQLPKDVAAGLYSDEELASIIRDNNFNPGLINRLVKTGMLGDESIDAIIDTQRTPPGIFRKVVGFFGITWKTPKERLVDVYDLSDDQEAALLADEDTQPGVAKMLRERAHVPPGQAKRAGTTIESDADSDEGDAPVLTRGQSKRSLNAGGQASTESDDEGFVPPGQARKNGVTGNAGKIPPGQAKKGR